MYEGFNKDTEFTKVNPVKLLTSGKITSDDIGKTVYLSNSAVTCQEWRVADINHDGTSGTVDLISKYTINDSIGWGSTSYTSSNVRSWLNNTFYGGFAANVQSVMKYMQYNGTNDSTNAEAAVNDKVKCPSIYELGFNTGTSMAFYPPLGNPYPIFNLVGFKNNSVFMEDNESAVFAMANGSSVYRLLTRNRYRVNDNTYIACVSKNGCIEEYPYFWTFDSDGSTIAIIRF